MAASQLSLAELEIPGFKAAFLIRILTYNAIQISAHKYVIRKTHFLEFTIKVHFFLQNYKLMQIYFYLQFTQL